MSLAMTLKLLRSRIPSSFSILCSIRHGWNEIGPRLIPFADA